MSFESGRKLGFAASLINVVMPVLLVTVYIAFLTVLITSLSPGNSVTPIPSSFLGGILLYAGVIVAAGVLGLVGFILFIVAMYQLSRYFGEPSIFKNILYALIISIVAGAAVVAMYLVFITSTIASSVSATQPTSAPFIQSIFTILIVAGVAFALAIVNGVLYMRAFNKLAEKSGVDSFKTAGLLYLIGIVLMVVWVGAILTWIAWIFAVIGFNRLKAAPATVTYPTQQPAYMIQPTRCSNCGTENPQGAIYCKNCGAKL